ncbi:hypothetical protein ELS24_22285 [Achromobacter spanius]|uniref:hypothetical protein n=1 Tax=Achromobacter spanius TaxID=217203 RepID=UPI000F8FA370|nr:hypothetical protein [Achromobacter spanius]AZS80930.1 hypothetical protein ELS24_22285 [Achromobacter spanius]
MNTRAAVLTRLIAVRLLWYVGIGAIALMALTLHTQFSVAVVLSAIAIYIPLSMLCLPLMAWLSIGRVAPARPGLPSAWPAWLAGAFGIALLAGYHLLAHPALAECGFLLLLVGGDLALARRESAQLIHIVRLSQTQQ